MKKAEEFLTDYNGEETVFSRYRVVQLLKYYARHVLKHASDCAMIQEEIPLKEFEDYELDEKHNEYGIFIQSGGYIRSTHWVCVYKESILKLINEL